MDTTLVQLKAQAYDLYVQLEQNQQMVNEYTRQSITPLRDKLIEVNKAINEKQTGSSNNATQEQQSENTQLAEEV